jgi:hypothetical protein
VFFTKVKYQNKIYQFFFFLNFIYSQKALSIIIMTPGKIINSQTREVIAKVMKFMKEEATNGIQIPVANFKARVLAATGIGENTYRRIQKEAQRVATGEIPKFTSPKKNRKRATPKSDLQARFKLYAL